MTYPRSLSSVPLEQKHIKAIVEGRQLYKEKGGRGREGEAEGRQAVEGRGQGIELEGGGSTLSTGSLPFNFE